MQDNNENKTTTVEQTEKPTAANKIMGFKGREQKAQALRSQADAQASMQLQQMMMSLYQKVYMLEQRLAEVKTVAQISDWRSLALMRLAVKVGITEDDVVAMTGTLQCEDFEKRSAEDDVTRNLVNADTETAADGLVSIVEIKVFKDGIELKEERIIRSKLNLGQSELYPELDRNIVGMKVGETKRFPLALQGKTDEAEVVLIGLRKAAAPVEAEPSKAE